MMNVNTAINMLWERVKEGGRIAKRRRHCVLAILTLLPLFAVILQDGLLALLFVVMMMLVAVALLERYCRVLAARKVIPEISSWNIEWRVDVNQIWIGTITDAEYARLRYQVFHDRTLFLAQALNIYQMVIKAVGLSCAAFPIAMFWGALAFAYFSPDTFVATVADIQGFRINDIPSAVRAIGGMFVSTLMLNTVVFAVLWPSSLGFINHFEKATSIAIRRHCRIAARGKVALWRT